MIKSIRNPRPRRKKFRRDWWGWLRRKHAADRIPHKEVYFPLENRRVSLNAYEYPSTDLGASGFWLDVPLEQYPILSSEIHPPKGEKSSHSKWHPFAHHQTRLSDFGHSGPGEGPIPAYVVNYDEVPFNSYFCWFAALSDVNLASDFGKLGSWNSSLPAFVNGTDRTATDWIPEPSQLSSLHHVALRRMLSGVAPELSLVNSVIELKDFLSLGHSVTKLVNSMKILTAAFQGRGSIFKGKTLRELFATAADGYLQLKFNFQPLVSDMLAVQAAWIQHTSRLAALMLRKGRPQVKHYHFALPEYPDSDETTRSYIIDGPRILGPHGSGVRSFDIFMDRELHRRVRYEDTVVSCSVQYTARWSEFQAAHARGLTLLDSLGVNFNPKILWNAIPWSFVIDWFTNVGKWIGEFETKWMKPTIHIMQYNWSVRRKRTINVSLKAWPNGDTFFSGLTRDYEYPQVTETSYRRSRESLDTSSIVLSGLSLTEYSLATALAITVGDRKQRAKEKRILRKEKLRKLREALANKPGNSGKTKHAK